MQLTLTGKHLPLTCALHDYAHQKFEKLSKYSDAISRIHLTFHVEHHAHQVEARMVVHGIEHHAAVSHEDMYAALDLLKKKLITQLMKDKVKHHPHLSKATLRKTALPSEEALDPEKDMGIKGNQI